MLRFRLLVTNIIYFNTIYCYMAKKLFNFMALNPLDPANIDVKAKQEEQGIEESPKQPHIKGIDSIFNIFNEFGISKTDVGKTLLKSAVKGTLDLNSLIGVPSTVTKRDKLKQKIYDIIIVLTAICVFLWLNIIVGLKVLS